MGADLEETVVFVRLDSLGRHVVDGSTAQVSIDARVFLLNSVGYPKVDELQPTLNADKILRFQVIVDDSVVVNNLLGIKVNFS